MQIEQSFSTKPVANLRLALYSLIIRGPDPLLTILPGNNYTFPLSPQMLRKESVALNTLYDLQGSAQNSGVSRFVDLFGQAPPIYTIRGTTGWKLHRTDGYLWDGITSIMRVENLLNTYAVKNQQQLAAAIPQYYKMEFYDFFRQEFWEVVPIGPQGIEQNSQTPQLAYFTFRFACLKRVSDAADAVIIDAIAAAFGGGSLAAITTAASATASMAAAYLL